MLRYFDGKHWILFSFVHAFFVNGARYLRAKSKGIPVLTVNKKYIITTGLKLFIFQWFVKLLHPLTRSSRDRSYMNCSRSIWRAISLQWITMHCTDHHPVPVSGQLQCQHWAFVDFQPIFLIPKQSTQRTLIILKPHFSNGNNAEFNSRIIAKFLDGQVGGKNNDYFYLHNVRNIQPISNSMLTEYNWGWHQTEEAQG